MCVSEVVTPFGDVSAVRGARPRSAWGIPLVGVPSLGAFLEFSRSVYNIGTQGGSDPGACVPSPSRCTAPRIRECIEWARGIEGWIHPIGVPPEGIPRTYFKACTMNYASAGIERVRRTSSAP